MTSFFTLWDIRTGNYVDESDDGVRILLVAAELIELNPGVYPDTLLLRWTDESGTVEDIAAGPALAALAHAVASRVTLGPPQLAVSAE
jgi:hypothetical protein